MTFCLISMVLIVVCDGVIAAGIPHLIQADRYDRRLYVIIHCSKFLKHL